MTEPFVFHFVLGDGQRPELLYVADVRAECGLCGYAQIQRFYHATPFHELELDSFETLCRSVQHKTSCECENCGTMMGPEHAKLSTTVLGFADEAGILRGYHNIEADQLEFRGVAPFRLDPQELPGFDAASGSGDFSDELTHDWFERTFSRVFNIKRAWAELIGDASDDQEGGWARFAPGFIAIVDRSWEEVVATSEDPDIAELLQDGTFELIELGIVPEALATHVDGEDIYGGMPRWMPQDELQELENDHLFAAALVSIDEVQRAIERTFEVAQLRFTFDKTDDDTWYRDITTPGEIVYERDVSVLSVLQRAVYTGITPGDAARLTAEEIAGKLLRVF